MEKIKKEILQIPVSGDILNLKFALLQAQKEGATDYECYSGNLIFFCEESEAEYLQRLLVNYKGAVKQITKKLKSL